MSDLDVVSALDALEDLLKVEPLAFGAIAEWQRHFDRAVTSAERGAQWPGIVARAHALSVRVDQAAAALSVKRDEIRKALDLHAQGARALRGYHPA